MNDSPAGQQEGQIDATTRVTSDLQSYLQTPPEASRITLDPRHRREANLHNKIWDDQPKVCNRKGKASEPNRGRSSKKSENDGCGCQFQRRYQNRPLIRDPEPHVSSNGRPVPPEADRPGSNHIDQ